MIFNLFKSKNSWQHKDSNVRIAAINDELDSNNTEDKTLLLSMLNEDKSELVRRAVLLKLNSFDDFLNASYSNDNKAVQEFSATQVRAILANQHKINLTNEQKLTFLNAAIKNQTKDATLLSYWLDHETAPSLVLALFEELVKHKNPTQFLLQVFTQKQSVEIQKSLLALDVASLEDASFLTKLAKKAVNDEVMQIIAERLAELNERQEKPKRLLKQKQLVLSKLLALRDLADYGQYLSKKAVLVAQWQDDLADLSCLADEDQQTLMSKFDKICGQLAQIFAPKEEAYQQAKIAEQLQIDKKSAKAGFASAISDFNQVITTAVFEDETLDQASFLSKLSELKENLSASVLSSKEQNEFLQQLNQLEKRLTQLPEIAQSVSDATYLISNISQLALPQTLSELNDRQDTYNEWLTKWKKVDQKASTLLPQSIKDAHGEITTLWRNGLKPLQQEQKQLFAQTKKKLIDLKRLLATGKYKVCFGLFKGVNQAITSLSVHQQQQLQRDLENVSEKMAEISDWEHYIATPRKKELLSEINALVTTPLDNPNEQADKVKLYRKTWNSLGHADEDLDQELNEQFNTACEQAFAPCRLYYAEQDKIRAQHLIIRQQILDDAGQLLKSINTDNTEALDFKELDGQLNKIQQRWQQAGEVDRQQYLTLLKQFKATLQPVNKAIKDFHDKNAASKQALITKASQQLDVEDITQAIESIKSIQVQWRDIGFAGKHQESILWQKFRAINDQVFAKRDEVKSTQQAALATLAENFNQTLIDIKATVLETVDISSLTTAKQQADSLLTEVLANKPVVKSVAHAIDTFTKELNAQIVQINVEQEKQSWQSLFVLLKNMTKPDFDVEAERLTLEIEYQQLTNFWQKRLIEQCSVTKPADAEKRSDKTLEIEVLAQVESPTEFAQKRMAVQVSLMQEQMQSGNSIDLSQCLVDWLKLGKLQESDLGLLSRLQNVFIK